MPCTPVIRQRLGSVQSSTRSSGSRPLENDGSKAPVPTPPPGSSHRDFLSFRVTSQPGAASFRSLGFLPPYTCHLFHPEVNCFAPRSHFPPLPFFHPGTWLPSKPKTRHGKTPSLTRVKAGFRIKAWGPCVPKWNSTISRRKLDAPPPPPEKHHCVLHRLVIKNEVEGTSLVVQWVGHHAPSAGNLGSIPGQGTRYHMQHIRPGTAKK